MTDDRSGIDRLRAAIDDVASEVEARQPARAPTRPTWVLGVAVAATVAVIAVSIGISILRPAPQGRLAEVQVLELKINGRDVRARIVEDRAPATIIVMPQRNTETVPAAVSAPVGGTR